jgi:plastocyanin
MKGFLLVAALAGLLLAGCTETPMAPVGAGTDATTNAAAGEKAPEMVDGKYVVHLMAGNQFSPSELSIPVGSTVVWIVDKGVHDVTEGEDGTTPAWSSEESGSMLTPGDKFERTFDVAGVVNYRCAMHTSSGMTGTLTVE